MDELSTEAAATVLAFNAAINRRDLDALAELMTPDHRFVDTADSVTAGKHDCVAAWRGFFEASRTTATSSMT